jgi:3'(2'), 5'-bisphosphate nucleotidase
MSYPSITIFRDLALKAGEAILEVYTSNVFGTVTKSDNSPVTRADQAADAIITAGLRDAYPHIALVTEEQADTHDQTVQDFLIVDPLDGTKEFIQKRDEFTVNIAYVQNGVPVMGVVYAPALGRMFYADETGAYEETGPFEIGQIGARTTLRVAQAQEDAPIQVVASKSHMDPTTERYIRLYNVAQTTSAGSSLKFCLIASGAAHLYPRCAPTMEWDTAAGDAVLRAAGGQMVHFPQMTPFTYGKAGFRNTYFIAAGQIDLKNDVEPVTERN